MAMSTTNGGRPERGAPKASGLVPSMAVRPPHGATNGDELEKPNDTSPSRASRSTIHPSTPAEYEWCIDSIAMPCRRASATNEGSAASNAVWQNPSPASTCTTAPAGSATTGTASPTTLPHSRCEQ